MTVDCCMEWHAFARSYKQDILWLLIWAYHHNRAQKPWKKAGIPRGAYIYVRDRQKWVIESLMPSLMICSSLDAPFTHSSSPKSGTLQSVNSRPRVFCLNPFINTPATLPRLKVTVTMIGKVKRPRIAG